MFRKNFLVILKLKIGFFPKVSKLWKKDKHLLTENDKLLRRNNIHFSAHHVSSICLY